MKVSPEETQKLYESVPEQHEKSKLSVFVDEHSKILSDSSNVLNRVIICAISLAFTFSIRQNIVVLYARTLNGYINYTNVSIIVFLNYIFSALTSFSFGIIGDKWRFDYLLIIAALSDVITFFVEATATQYYQLAIAYVVGDQPGQSILVGYINKMLPIYDAKSVNITFQTYWIVGFVLGPVCGGIIAYFTSYRTVFYVSAIIASILLIYSLVFVLNSQTQIVSSQLALKQRILDADQDILYQQEESPLLDQLKESVGSDHILPYCDNNNGKESKDTSMNTKLPKYHWFVLGLLMFMQGVGLGAETCLITWFTTYIEEEFDSNTIVSTGLVSLFAFSYIVGCKLVLKYIKIMQQQRDSHLSNNHNNGIILMVMMMITIIIVWEYMHEQDMIFVIF